MNARQLALRLLAFGGLAAWAAAHWARLVTDVSPGHVVAVVTIAVAGATALGLLELSRASRPVVLAAASAVAAAMLALGAVAAGIAPELLAPTGWDRLAAELDHALLGVQGVDWPYDGPDEWIRTAILLGAPLLLSTAAALGFWPATPEAQPPLRAASLVVLLVLYGVAATTRDPGDPLVRGLVLLALIAAWLWLPRVRAREAAVAIAGVALAGLLALPAAAALDGDRPWFDYRSWNPFGDEAGVAFDWTHHYGPLDWPRQGTTLLNVKSERPHYWKAQTLDGFDGVRWLHTGASELLDVEAEMPFADQGGNLSAPWRYGSYNQDWDHQIRFTVRSLSTELVVGAGLTYAIADIPAEPAADGTTELIGPPLDRGTTYTASVYEPDPDRFEMTGAPEGYADFLARYTAIALPPTASDPTGSVALVPLRGSRPDPGEGAEAAARLHASPYDSTYDLALEVTGGAATVYDAVKAVESHLRDSYRYSEQVPESPYPLVSFLFQDRRGYCQQFSGAMALMLRMVGIPARVAAGFSPGTLNPKTGEYRVRDLDAHSWVEVYFAGIGWVPFDPTPSAAPAESQASSALATSAAAADAGEVSQVQNDPATASEQPPGDDEAGDETTAATGDRPGSGGGGIGGTLLVPFAALALLAAGGALTLGLRVQRRRALGPAELAEAQLAELRRALPLVGWEVASATTLRSLASDLERGSHPVAAAYASALGGFRYDPAAAATPGVAARRAVRRELASGGPRRILRALRALPPGGPTPG